LDLGELPYHVKKFFPKLVYAITGFFASGGGTP
jgi:hypothetical protein